MKLDRAKEEALLKQFNRRETGAFGELYTCLYDHLFYFTTDMCRGSDLSPDDVIHDVFIKIWVSSDVQFTSVEGVKAYIFTSIRNYFLNYMLRKKREQRYRMAVADDDRMIVQVVDSGVRAYINQAVDTLPAECAEVLRYHLEGWYTKEIAERMNLSERTVYNRKNEAIDLLRSRLDKETLAIIALICSQL